MKKKGKLVKSSLKLSSEILHHALLCDVMRCISFKIEKYRGLCASDAASIDRYTVKMRLQNNSQMRCPDEKDQQSMEHRAWLHWFSTSRINAPNYEKCQAPRSRAGCLLVWLIVSNILVSNNLTEVSFSCCCCRYFCLVCLCVQFCRVFSSHAISSTFFICSIPFCCVCVSTMHRFKCHSISIEIV